MLTAVILGVIEVTIDTPLRRLYGEKDWARSYEQTEWAQIEIEF